MQKLPNKCCYQAYAKLYSTYVYTNLVRISSHQYYGSLVSTLRSEHLEANGGEVSCMSFGFQSPVLSFLISDDLR